MNLYALSVTLLFLCFFSAITASSDDDPAQAHAGGDIVSVNCGSTGASAAARSGREWRGDVQKKELSSLVELKGSSTTSTVVNHNFTFDPVPYRTARLSRSRFSYAFQVNPGQKILRLHFNSGPYKGFKRYKDLFDVEAGPFTLLGNFSVSLAAVALGVNSFFKEFCMSIAENQLLYVNFSPASKETYAFVNGIEIVAVPATRSYFNTEDAGVQLIGESPVYVDNSTALEIIRRLNIREDTDSSSIDDIGDGFGMWETVPKQKGNKVNNVTWKVSVDVGFRYLVRLHFSRMGFKFAELGGFTFEVQINQKIFSATSDGVKERDDDGDHLYRDYMVGMKGSKQEGKRNILICLQSRDHSLDRHVPLKGFEILKLSNPDNSLASPNPLPFVEDSSYQSLQTLLKVLGPKSTTASATMIVLLLITMIAYALWKNKEAKCTVEENMSLVKADRVCRQFSLHEILLATRSFDDGRLIGKGGFGNVYKGIIDNGRETVAIKRLKSNSKQGAHEFLTEIEMLTKIRHVNVVSLIGYCSEQKEMILVYEYIAFGSLADHLFNVGNNGEHISFLTWKQRLNISIGVGRGLYCLHTVHSVIHRDVKASNILLDNDLTGKLTDFGVAQDLTTVETTRVVKGTLGYIAPEYFTTYKLTRKSDTYGFGVVLLEILSGRRAVDVLAAEDDVQVLTMWAKEKISQGEANQIVDASLKGEISDESLKVFVGVAEICLHDEPKKRPTMAQVVQQLEHALELQESSKSSISNEKSNLGDAPPLNVEAISSATVWPPGQLRMDSGAKGKGKADPQVELLLGKLQRLLLYHAHFPKGAKDKVGKLEKDLHLLIGFLRDNTTKKRRKDNRWQELVRQIDDVVYEAEEIIDEFINLETETQTQNFLIRTFKMPVNLHNIARKVEFIGKRVEAIFGPEGKLDFATVSFGDRSGAPQEPEPTLIGQDIVVGFEDEVLKIIGCLNEKIDRLDVISIVGMRGLGKTTLARKIFYDKKIEQEFPIHIWVHVSQEFRVKDVYLTILKEFTRITEDINKKNDWELAQMVYAYLEKKKFLIIMDDVWTIENWDEIQIALPKSNNAGKVFITSHHVKVAQHASRPRAIHKLRFLTQDESWLLLQYEVFGKLDCPPELDVVGKLIAEQCDGLPQAIVIIGGILAKKISTSDDMNTKKIAWEKVSNAMSAYLNEDPDKRMERIIALSYDNLPYPLTACFLYLGMFPKGFEISVWKLIQMWIAEGFIPEENGISLEEAAEHYLDELINRSLVRVDRRSSDGRVKTCRIHGILHDFCKNEAGSEKQNFLEEMKNTSEGFECSVGNVEKYRRICIHSNVLDFISLKPFSRRVRSFVCFSKEDILLPTRSTSTIPAAFKRLRVLDIKPIIFKKIPTNMYQLVHLRYIVLRCHLTALPAPFAKLWNIETLIIDTTSPTLKIKANIWKMRELRHLKTNASAILCKVRNSNEGEMLQTLDTISTQSCTKEVFDRACNLKKLGIRGKLASLLHGKTVSFENLVKLDSLEKLKLLNDVYPNAASEVPLHGLPPPCQFPPKLKSLTLSDTFLDWHHMSTLGLLENLKVLKLKNNAFWGKIWNAKDGCFHRLEVLHIGHTNLSFWVASHHHYPKLRCLELHNCEELKQLPIGLADIPNFQLLSLYHSNHAAPFAIKIHEAKQQKNIKDGEFKLSIFPSTFRA